MRVSSERENPKMRKNKVYFRIFGTALSIALLAVFIIGCTNDELKDQSVADPVLSASIAETFPANQADTVVINPVVAVTFKSTASASQVSASTLILKEGTNPVAGTVATSGTTVSFTPSNDLKPNTTYTATLTNSLKSGSSKDTEEHSWSFKTGKNRNNTTISVVSVTPLKNATEVPVDVKPTVTFNQDMTLSMTKLVTISLFNGTTPVAGKLTFSGKTATFTPDNTLTVNTLYTTKVVLTGKSSDENEEDEQDDDHQSASTFTWNFTTSGGGADVTPPTVVSVIPASNSTSIPMSSKVTATFSEAMNPTTISSTTFTLKQGTTAIAGTVSYSGNIGTFTPAGSLTANAVYTATITTEAKDAAGNALASNYTWSFTTSAQSDVTLPTILSSVPANNANQVATSIHPSVTFSEAMNPTTISSTTFTLKQGTTAIAGTVSYSGNIGTFTPASSLTANAVYTVTITTGAKDAAGNALASNYTWSFTTAAQSDVTPPTVLSSVPANNASLVATSIHPSVTFSEAMNPTTISSTTFTLKQGTTAIAGTVSYSGNTATFTPSSALANNTVYTVTITSGAKDATGNALASNYTSSFTTVAPVADTTPPTVVTVVPANSATSIAVNSNITATFSEAMNPATITTTTFTLKQGTTTIAGSVAYSGTTATFNPTNDLAGGTVYTATITTGAMDVAGNTITTTKTWSFTTIATAPVVSFATQVLPILQSKCMPCHGATSPSAGISITNYTTVSKLSNSQIDNSGMYTKLGVTTAEQTLIKAWIAAGRLNN